MIRWIRTQQEDEGFTLIELLVVVIIIGILAAIAIPVFLNQRERAWRAAAQSDLRNAAVAAETFYTDEGDYDATVGALRERGYNPTEDVWFGINSTAGEGFTAGQVYCLAAQHQSNTSETWYLGSGGTVDDTFETGCPQSSGRPAVTDP